MNILELKIMEELLPTINSLECDIVKISFSNGNLQILLEKLNGEKVTIADCTEVSKRIATLIDVKELIKSKYILEVSSAGINRPLVFAKDFIKYRGARIKVKFKTAIEINHQPLKKIHGTIIESNEQQVSIELSEAYTKDQTTLIVNIPLEQIAGAELDVEIKI